MSRIGKKPLRCRRGHASIDGQTVKVKGPKGELSVTLVEEVEVTMDAAASPSALAKGSSVPPRCGPLPHAGEQSGPRRHRGVLGEAGDPGRRLPCRAAGQDPATAASASATTT